MDLAKSALLYAQMGWRIFPVVPGQKRPPAIKNWAAVASASSTQVNAWWARGNFNIGLNCGTSGLCVIDIDVTGTKRGRQTLDLLELERGQKFSETRTAKTPSGGLHLYYEGSLPNSQNVVGKDLWDDGISHVDTRGVGGYVLLPPSLIMVAGAQTGMYEWVNGATFPISLLDQWMIDLFAERESKRSNNAPQESVVEPDSDTEIAWFRHHLDHDAQIAIEGEGGELRTLTLAALAKDHGLSEAIALDEIYLSSWNGRCQPPWEFEELAVKVHNAYEYLKDNAPGAHAIANDPVVTERDAKIVVEAAKEKKLPVDLVPRGEQSAPASRPKSTPMDYDPSEDENDRPKTTTPTITDFIEPEDHGDLLGPEPTLTEFQKARAAIQARDESEPERIWSFAELCNEFVYITQMDRFVYEANPTLVLKTEQFDKRFAYAKPDTSPLKTVSAVMFNKIMGTIRKPMRAVFLPGESPGMLPGGDYNLYRPSDVAAVKGETTLWDEHLRYLWPKDEDRNHVLNWLAWVLQNISLKPKHLLLLAGYTQGTGKSFVRDVFARVIGLGNVAPVGTIELSSSFNKWALGSKLLTIEELDALEKNVIKHTLHPIITQEDLTINDKGISTFKADNCFGILAMTNEDAALRLADNDRRYLVVRTEAVPRTQHYYNDLYSVLDDGEALGAIAYQLQTRELGDYNAMARAPMTDAKREMVAAGMSDLETWMTDNAGSWPLAGRIITIDDIEALLPSRLERMSRLHNTIASLLQHRFKGERLGVYRLPDGQRAVLWAINGTAATKIGGVDYVALYMADKAKRVSGDAGDKAASEFSE